MIVDPTATLLVLANADAAIGSLQGSGTVEVGQSGQGSQTLLSLDTPRGQAFVYTGSFDGSGGTIQMNGPGTQTIGNVTNTGPFQLAVEEGTMLVDGTVDAQALTVNDGATFGGPGKMNFSESAVLKSGATFAATIDGTAAGQYTQLIDSTTQGQTAIELNGNTLSLEFGQGFTPQPGENFPLLTTSGGSITGQFADVRDVQSGQDIPLNGQPFAIGNGLFQLDETGTSITLSALAAATTIQLSSSANASNPGQAVTFTAAVSSGGSPVTSGSVTFSLGGVPVRTVPLASDGTASFTTSSLPTGTTTVTAAFASGSGADLPSSASVTQTVNPYTTTVSLSSSAGPSAPGQAVTFTATVSSGGGPVPTGSVTFSSGGVTLQVVPLSPDGTASYTTSTLPPGTTAVTAAFASASGADLPSSASLTQAVNPYTTMVTLTLISVKKKHGKKVYELMATVEVIGSGSPVPEGTVVFSRGGVPLGSVALQNGVASLSIGKSKPKRKEFTAAFLGTSTYSASTVNEDL